MNDAGITMEMFELHTRVMINLGIDASALVRYETMVEEALVITDAMICEQPDNVTAFMVR